jgi:hypothetical protein
MLPVVKVPPTTSIQAWRCIEEDYTLRHSLVATEWATEHLSAWNAVLAEGRERGNSAYYGPALVEMEIADADKRAEWSYLTCCEIWEIQGRAKSRLFFRAVLDCCLQPLFSTRESCFKSELKLHETRTRKQIPQGHSAIFGHMKRQMDKLRDKWSTKLEIATRDNEYQEHLTRGREAQQASALAVPTLSAPPATRSQTTTRGGRKARVQSDPKRYRVIFGAIEANLKGKEYCAELDSKRLSLPREWTKQGCPTTYTTANKDPKWRKRIQDEKSRFRQRYYLTPASERREIIEGTRRTRQRRVKVNPVAPA